MVGAVLWDSDLKRWHLTLSQVESVRIELNFGHTADVENCVVWEKRPHTFDDQQCKK